MIDAMKITNFNQNKYELEESILFWVAAASHNGPTSARALDKFLMARKYKNQPFNSIVACGKYRLSNAMKRAGIGCNGLDKKAGTFWNLSNSGINLKTCTVNDLESFKGIGRKTSRCFLLHSRPNQQYAGLDRHILSLLRSIGYKDAPKDTPGSDKLYKYWEDVVLNEVVPKTGMTTAEFDLEGWKLFRVKEVNNVHGHSFSDTLARVKIN